MEGRSKRYKKIDFLGEGQVKNNIYDNFSVHQFSILKLIMICVVCHGIQGGRPGNSHDCSSEEGIRDIFDIPVQHL